MIACEPTERLLVASRALPPLSVAEPSVVVPSMKVTVPVGVPLPGAAAVTVAVNVTDWPNTAGLTEAMTAVLDPSWFTVWFRARRRGAGDEVGVAAVGRRDRLRTD